MKKSLRLATRILFLLLTAGLIFGQEQNQIQEEVTVRWWLVPVYAMTKDGSPVLDLKAEDLDVYANHKRLEVFDLFKKEFKTSSTPPHFRGAKPTSSFEKRMVFLVFDSAFSPYHLLEKAKKVAAAMMAGDGSEAQFLALSIEPYAGLKPVCGPTRDRHLIRQSVEKFIAGKKAEYLRLSALDSTDIRSVYPKDSRYADRNPDESKLPGRLMSRFEKLDTQEKRRIAAVYLRSLMTLNLLLSYFKDNSKVIYLFSCGVPASAIEWKTETILDPTLAAQPGVTSYLNISPDELNLQALKKIGQDFNRNGSLLFLVNPSEARLSIADQESGEQSLRLLADESGGRYFDGPEKDVAQEINDMESAYYEISFPDSDEYHSPNMDFEIRAKDPQIQIYTVKRISGGKEYRQMSQLEKEVLILYLLDRGPYTQAKLKIVEVDSQVITKKDLFSVVLNLPPELGQSEWEIYKVWRKVDSGEVRMETARFRAASPGMTIEMRRKKGFGHVLVLIHGATGTALIFRPSPATCPERPEGKGPPQTSVNMMGRGIF